MQSLKKKLFFKKGFPNKKFYKKVTFFIREEEGYKKEEEFKETDQKILTETEPVFNSFEPGAIHNEKFRDFWANTLNADTWVLQTLEKGYMIPFRSSPTKVEK